MSLPDTLGPMVLETSPETAKIYAELTYDYNPIHVDPEFAATTPFGKAISHGTMALNLAVEAAERALEGKATLGEMRVRFSRPMPVGETLTASGKLTGEGSYEMSVTLPDGTRTLEGVLSVTPL